MNEVAEVYQRVLDRQQRNASPAKLYAALAKARGEFPDIPKNRTASIQSDRGNYSYKYADLADILHKVTPAMAKHGLGVWQDVTGEGVVTTVYHESGETKISDPWPIKPMKATRFQRDNNLSTDAVLYTATDYQSAVQATKRYSLQSALGISTEETIEGAPEPSVSKDFKDSHHDGLNTGVKGVPYDPKRTPIENARAYADGIIKQLQDAKTEKGLNGVWDRNERVIEALQANYPDQYANVLDAYETHQVGMREAADA